METSEELLQLGRSDDAEKYEHHCEVCHTGTYRPHDCGEDVMANPALESPIKAVHPLTFFFSFQRVAAWRFSVCWLPQHQSRVVVGLSHFRGPGFFWDT